MVKQHTVVAAPTGWSSLQVQRVESICKNAVRLLQDAALLRAYDRHATAYTLATLALEEAGKVAICIWEQSAPARPRWSYHQKKQAAGACLLLSESALQFIDAELATLNVEQPDELDSAAREALRSATAKFIHNSSEAKLLALVPSGVLEKIKSLGFYRDEWMNQLGLEHTKVTSGMSSQAVDEGWRAISTLRSHRHVDVALAIYATESFVLQKGGAAPSPEPPL